MSENRTGPPDPPPPPTEFAPAEPAGERRVHNAALWLEAQAAALRLGVAPALAVTCAVILVATSDRPAGLVVLTTGGGIVAALILSGLLGGFAALLHAQAAQAEAMDRQDARLARLVEVLEALPAAGTGSEGARPAVDEGKLRHLAEFRHALRAGLWNDAEALARAFADAHPDDPEAARVAGELATAREAAAGDLLQKLGAAREVNDPERVIDLRDGLRPLLAANALRDLDRDLARWFLLLIQRRLRSGTVKPDVAVLAARVAGSLDNTPEGASLRASLPTLRRAAGLCARCGRPYAGIENACPVCVSGATGASLPADGAAPTPPPDGPEAPPSIDTSGTVDDPVGRGPEKN